jgi:hypothetical protein
MANLTAVISADTSKFVSGIKSAQDTLDKFIKETNAASDSTKKNIVATDEQVAAYQRVIKQLDKVGSGTMSTSQQQKALTDQIKELKVQWQNLSDDAKKSEFGKSMADTMKIATDELSKLKTQLASIDDIKPGEKVKTQLRQTTEMLQNLSIQYAQLSAAEKTSPFGVELAKQIDEVRKKAGSLKDVVADVDAEIKVMASDTPHLDAFNQGLGIGADLVSTYTSLIAKLTGDENKLKDAIATIATVQSFANLSTKITNQLQSSSILMMKTRKIQEAAAAAAIRIRTAAETKGTVATKAATVAQAAFNTIAKANPYVLLATALVAAGAAILGFTLKTKDSTKALYDAKEVQDAYNKKMEETNGEVGLAIGKFTMLKTQYEQLKSAAEKQKWIKDNTTAFNELGISVNNINDADNVFIKNSDKVIRAMQLRAQAAAIQTVYQEQYAEAYKKSLKISEGKQSSYMPSTGFRNVWKQAGIGEGDYSISTTMMPSSAGAYSQSLYTLTPSGVAKMQEYWKQQGETAMQSFTDGAAGMLDDMAAMIREAESLESSFKTTGGNNGGGGSSNNDDIKAVEGSITAIKNEIAQVQRLRDAQVVGTEEWIKQDNKLKELNEKLEDAIALEKYLHREEMPKLEPIEISIIPNRVELPKKLPEIQIPIRPVVKKKTFAEIKAEIDSVLESYNKLADGVSGVVGSINSIYNAFKSLGERMEETENGWEAFVVAFETGMTVLDSVANIISSITTIMELLNTVKQASTLLTQKDTIATVANTGAKVGEATANATEAGTAGAAAAAEAGKSVASVPYAGPALAAAAILMVMGIIAGVIASAKTFATGGIIQGGNTIGDYNLARVNSGEMILNGTQQKRMFNLLDGNTTTGNNAGGTPQVEFKIKGTELIGCINNVSKKRSKI